MKLILLACLSLVVATTAQQNYEIAKVNKNRTFIVLHKPVTTDKEFIEQLKLVIRDLDKNKSVDLANKKVAISFFTDKNFADYKPETNELYKQWSQSYIAEYTNANKKLVIYPKDLKKLKHIVLK